MTNIQYLTKIIERMIEMKHWFNLIPSHFDYDMVAPNIKIMKGNTYFDIELYSDCPQFGSPFSVGLRYESDLSNHHLNLDDASSYQLIIRDDESFMASPDSIFINAIYSGFDDDGSYEILNLPQGDTYEEDLFCFSTVHDVDKTNMVELYNAVKHMINKEIFFKVHHNSFKCGKLEMILKELNAITEESIQRAYREQYVKICN